MPKEFTEDVRAEGHGCVSGIAKGTGLSVRWTKDGKREPHAAPIGEPLTVTYDRADGDLDGIIAIIALDRAGCNRLIRALRQARNDVYARDE